MNILGFNETSHDAAAALINNDGEVLFAGHAERYSKQKNDWYTNKELLDNAASYGHPDITAYYEKPFLKATRKIVAGGAANWRPTQRYDISFKHHLSHAAAGYYTSPFDDAVIVVLDAIGEWSTGGIYTGEGDSIRKIENLRYPLSFGLFYTAFTSLVGLKPNEEEYILMGMAAYGNPSFYYDDVNSHFPSINYQPYNLHQGVARWPHSHLHENDKFDIAASVQKVYEERLIEYMVYAKNLTGKKNLVFMGGCALNCSANTLLWSLFDDVWIMPNPGDAGSSLGAAAAAYGKHLNWKHPYLGYDLGGEYPVEDILQRLIESQIAPVATGRAEFGPRALGNRSILADPRDAAVKDKVNLIKKRELFRPFAPVVLEEYASEWFEMNFASPYMQYTVKCLKPDLIPAVVHVDGTSRVQTVNREQHEGLYELLTRWYEISGVPVLLNTSLNVKGQPLLNDEDDILEWESTYNMKIIH